MKIINLASNAAICIRRAKEICEEKIFEILLYDALCPPAAYKCICECHFSKLLVPFCKFSMNWVGEIPNLSAKFR